MIHASGAATEGVLLAADADSDERDAEPEEVALVLEEL
jgi:hypothetical protein